MVNGGVVRQLENLGIKDLPTPIYSKSKKHTAAKYVALLLLFWRVT